MLLPNKTTSERVSHETLTAYRAELIKQSPPIQDEDLGPVRLTLHNTKLGVVICLESTVSNDGLIVRQLS